MARKQEAKLKSADLIKKLKKDGWRHVRTDGSHHIFEKEGNPNTLAVPHPKKDLPIGTVRDLLKKAGLKQETGGRNPRFSL